MNAKKSPRLGGVGAVTRDFDRFNLRNNQENVKSLKKILQNPESYCLRERRGMLRAVPKFCARKSDMDALYAEILLDFGFGIDADRILSGPEDSAQAACDWIVYAGEQRGRVW
jgi:hypothetical protein